MPKARPVARTATIKRQTQESTIIVDLNLDGSGRTQISTGIPFFDHMLTAFGKHSLFDLTIDAAGDVEVDAHHTIEDTAIVLGRACAQALGDKTGISRFADCRIPLDEALASCVVDLAGRPYVVHTGEPDGQTYALIGGGRGQVAFPGSMTKHFVESFGLYGQFGIHLELIRGRDPHHIVEAQFKALARAMRFAATLDSAVTGVPSTKGSL